MKTNPINTLRREHTNMRSVLVLVRDQLALLEARHAPDFVLLANALYYMRKFPGTVHHPKEDAVFERLAELDPSCRPVVERARRQHQEIYDLEDWLIETALNAPKPGTQIRARLVEFGRHYLDLQRQHSEAEEQLLFPVAARQLLTKDWAEIKRRFKQIDDPVFGIHPGDRYELLYEHLMRESAET